VNRFLRANLVKNKISKTEPQPGDPFVILLGLRMFWRAKYYLELLPV
jgi:hypothetical protein